MSAVYLPPFNAEDEIVSNGGENEHNPPFHQDIPNEASLSSSVSQVDEFLDQELRTRVLDDLHPHLWLIALKAGDHIDPLHKQVIKGRNVVVAEDTSLHLVWYYDKIYLKPIPHCLLNYQFWDRYLTPQSSVADVRHGQHGRQQYKIIELSENCLRAMGLLRSYAHLIKHESDFSIALSAKLVPEWTTYKAFQKFIAPFRTIIDDQVSKRYQYGQLRLTRLDYAVRLCRPASAGGLFPWFYHRPYWQTGAYLSALAPVLVFIFASLSLILSAMQVILAALGQDAWAVFVKISWGFSVAVIILLVTVTVGLILAVALLFLHQGQFAVRMQLSERRARHTAI